LRNLTELQRLAVEAKGPRILVTAGAGSGKTGVLAERICHLVHERGVSANKILALTFTDQAAREMKQRVEQKLGQTDAAMLTFHRFCGRIVRENPLLADVDPAFTLIDEATGRAILQDLANHLIYDVALSDALRWMETCGLNESVELLLSLYGHWRERPLDIGFLREKTENAITSSRKAEWEKVKSLLHQLNALYQSGRLTAKGTVDRLRAISSAWEQFPQNDWNLAASNEASAHQEAERALQTIFSQVTRNVAKEVKPYFEQLTVWKKEQLWKEFMKDQTGGTRLELLMLLEQLDSAYRQVKEEQGWCDFADLQRKAHHVLQHVPEIRTKYGKQFRHILVDEFQDTSPIQQSILDLLEMGGDGETSLFMVGDARQSIYRFRGADVKGFEQMRKQLGESEAFIELRENFRSSASLVAFVSDLTKTLFGDEGAVPGIPSSAEEEPTVELLVPMLSDEQDQREMEADLITKRILEIGPAMWGDIAILLQTRTHLAKYRKALESRGIPYTVYAGSGYWERQEVQDLYHLLRLIENPGDDLAILGYLRGPLVGMTDDGLWRLAANGGLTKGFLNSVRDEGVSLSKEDNLRLTKAHDLLVRLRTRYDKMGLADWIYLVLYEDGIAERLGGTNFDRIVRMADESEKRGEIHLSDLLSWWERLIEQDEKDGEAAYHHAKGVVRIMTIHAAKGLQFPIVFVPDLTHRFTMGVGRLHMSDTLGLTLKYYDEIEKSWFPSLSYAKAVEEEKTAMVSEQMRLFYVAVTRAQERLILSGAAAAFTEKESLEECSNCFDWLPFLIPDLRERGLGQGMIERQAWKLWVRNEVPVVPRIRSAEGLENNSVMDALANREDAAEQTNSITRSEKLSPVLEMAPTSRMWSVTEWVDLLAEGVSDSSASRGIPLIASTRLNLEGHEWGHVLHSVLEHVRYEDDLDTIRTRHLKAALASAGISSSSLIEHAWERLGSDIERYLQSDIHHECRNAQVVYCELPFAIRLFEGNYFLSSDDARKGELYGVLRNTEQLKEHLKEGMNEGIGRESGLLMNGVIDKIWLRADGGATVVDFKTHRCRSNKEVQQLIQRYTPQVQLYVHVVEKLLGWNVDRAGLYLTTAGAFVEVPYNQVARENLLERMYRIWRQEAGEGKAQNSLKINAVRN
jgi:ATP-dependent helicase/nuclease subunit A